jgi:hypothetical protein
MKKFKLKNKPRKPVRKRGIRFKDNIDDMSGASLKEMLISLEKRGVDLTAAYVEVIESYDYYGCCDCDGGGTGNAVISYSSDESEEDFKDRLASYEKRLAAFLKWEKDNKKAIKEEKTRLAEAKAKKKAAASAKAIEKLEKKLAKLKK